jgi:mono/diheme cytochrome c family protein
MALVCVAPLAKEQEPGPGEGARTFQRYCALCHGEHGKGDGVASRLYTPRPANLTLSTRSREYMERIVREGGAALGRSPNMPSWEQELGEQRIAEVIAYVRSLKVAQP